MKVSTGFKNGINRMDQRIHKARAWRGTIRVPGDKSISHRALMFGALADGVTTIANLAPGKDVQSTAECLRRLGVRIERRGAVVEVHGAGPVGLMAPSAALDAGNSGTTLRLLTGILASRPFDSLLDGDDSLRRRPMGRIVEPLGRMGARIDTADGGRAPLRIRGTRLHPADMVLPVASAQVKSCLLLAALLTEGTTAVTEPALSRDHTERLFDGTGVRYLRKGLRIEITGPQAPLPADLDVPGDISSAAFLLVAAALIGDSELVIENVGVNPTRTGILDVLGRMGAVVEERNPRTVNGEPRADLEVRSGGLRAVEIAGDDIPRVIDELPVLAVAASQASGRTVVRDAGELRVKETDRIAAVAKNLAAMGVSVEVGPDGFAIEGPQRLSGAVIDSMDDHRIAMAFAVAGLVADGDTIVQGTECADISFPGFFDLLKGAESAA
jgi:3-phosphoshikimate 1-carboxyvinyltransferase